jgi:hypothetical protein
MRPSASFARSLARYGFPGQTRLALLSQASKEASDPACVVASVIPVIVRELLDVSAFGAEAVLPRQGSYFVLDLVMTAMVLEGQICTGPSCALRQAQSLGRHRSAIL